MQTTTKVMSETVKSFYAAVDKLKVQGYSQFYFIAITITDSKHPLFGAWFLVIDPTTNKENWCEIDLMRNDLFSIKRTANTDQILKAVEDGYVNLIREAKKKYDYMYPSIFIDY